MIERLEGRVVSKTSPWVHLQAGPVVLAIRVPLSTSQRLPEGSERAGLWIHLHWREEGPDLYGFGTRVERELFRELIKVQGVGPRIALSILSHLSPAELVQIIRDQSLPGLTRVPGIGPKTAARILVELGAKIDRLEILLGEEGGSRERPGAEDAVQALTALGYPLRESRKAVERILQANPGIPLDECIRRSLQSLSGAAG